MRFLIKFAIVLVLPAFVPAEPFPPLATVTYTGADSPVVPAGQMFACTPVTVWDGDGPIWCAEGPKIRVAGIAARELDGSCRPGHPCPATSGTAARDRLVALLGGGRGTLPSGHIAVRAPAMTCRSDGRASGDRTAAWCTSPAFGDLSCAVVRTGGAVRWPRFWREHRC